MDTLQEDRTNLPSRRYRCLACGTKGRRGNSAYDRLREPICPPCENALDNFDRHAGLLPFWQSWRKSKIVLESLPAKTEFGERGERSKCIELSELVDGAYDIIETSYKPEGEYNKKWKAHWLEKAKRLVPGVGDF
jgi:hypothetical protein